jgi:hypothetical protein
MPYSISTSYQSSNSYRSFFFLSNISQTWVARPEWTSTHQCTIVDAWCSDGCTFFLSLPLPGLTKVANSNWLFFTFFSQVGFSLRTFFFLTPHACPGLTYLPTFRLLAYAPWPPPSPIYLLTYPPTHPSIYLLIHLPTFSSTYLPMH